MVVVVGHRFLVDDISLHSLDVKVQRKGSRWVLQVVVFHFLRAFFSKSLHVSQITFT